jgi:transcriptional regulator with XRE-family HTH domain
MDTEKTVESDAPNAGETLRQLLKNKGLSQDKAARLADLRLGFLSRLIRGKRILEPELSRRLATKWKLTPSEAHQLEQVAQAGGGEARKKTVNETKGVVRRILGDFMREKRVLHRMTAKDVAEHCGIKLPNYVKFEKGRAVPNPATVTRFAQFLPLSPKDRVELFRRLALALAEHASLQRATTVPPLMAMVELALLNHDQYITGPTEVAINPLLEELPEGNDAIRTIREALNERSNELGELLEADPRTARLPGAMLRHRGRLFYMLPVLVTL